MKPIPQFDLPVAGDVFNLASEQGKDGARIIAEMAEQAKRGSTPKRCNSNLRSALGSAAVTLRHARKCRRRFHLTQGWSATPCCGSSAGSGSLRIWNCRKGTRCWWKSRQDQGRGAAVAGFGLERSSSLRYQFERTENNLLATGGFTRGLVCPLLAPPVASLFLGAWL